MVRRTAVRRSVAGAVVLLLAFGGYAAWYHLFPGSSRPALVGEDPRILVYQRPTLGGMDALLEGTLRYDPETRCLSVESPEGSRFGVVWPRGTRPVVEGDRPGVRVRAFLGRVGGTVMLDGDQVSLGGGGDAQTNDLLAGSECRYDEVFRITGQSDVLNRAASGPDG